MKNAYEKTSDAMYLSFRKGKVFRTVKLEEKLIVDVDKSGNILGIELLNAKEQFSPKSFNTFSKIAVAV